MSQDSTSSAAGAEGGSLTRRERRELERRREAAEAAGDGSWGAEVVHAAGPTHGTRATDTVGRGGHAQDGEGSAEPAAVKGAQRAVSAAFSPPRRFRRRIGGVLAVVLVLLMVAVPLVVARFFGSDEQAPTTTGVVAGDAPIAEAVHVAGRVGATPVVSLLAALEPASTLVRDVLVTGDGPAVSVSGPVLLSVSTFSGTDGTNTTGTGSGTRLYLGTLDPTVLGDQLTAALDGVREGSRVVLRAPVVDTSGARHTEITVVDVLPTNATGTERAPVEGMPPVTVAQDGTVSASVVGLAAPTISRAETLVRGDGEQVTATSRVVARTALVSWSTGEVISSTWGQSVVPGVIDMTDTLSGISQDLVDATVGSRVVLALSADEARGDQAVVVVIDVLAIDHGSGATAAVPSPTSTS